jgi:hypothetical protein
MDLPNSMSQRVSELMSDAIREHDLQLAEVIDYLLVESHPRDDRTPAGQHGPVELSAGVTLEQLDRELAERLLDAAELRGENWESPARPFYAVQAYVRRVWQAGDDPPFNLYTWDHDRRIWPTVQLSRLVRDNAVSTQHAVRRLIHRGGSERLVPFAGFESHSVYRLYPERSGWLDADEAVELQKLMEAHWQDPKLPDRTGRALWRADAVTSERYLEDALPVVVGAFESLLKVGRTHLTAQFTQRVPALAADFGVELSGAECEDVYNDRSALVHGAGVDLSVPHDMDEFGRLFNALQETLRRVVRKAIEDREFAASFEDDSNITRRWPTVVKVRKEIDITI